MVRCEQHLSKLLMIMVKTAPVLSEISCKDILTKISQLNLRFADIVKWHNKALVKLNFQFDSEYLLQRIDNTIIKFYNIHKKRSDVRVV